MTYHNKFSNIQQEFSNDDCPRPKQRMEGEKVKDLDPAEEESQPHELVSHVHDDASVLDVNEYSLKVSHYYINHFFIYYCAPH